MSDEFEVSGGVGFFVERFMFFEVFTFAMRPPQHRELWQGSLGIEFSASRSLQHRMCQSVCSA